MPVDFLRFIVPRIERRAFVGMLVAVIAGAALAGVYGILHDQVTYTISEEYFTRFKFQQFAWADPGGESPRVFAGIIGFLATWWVGALAAWILSRISLSREGKLAPARELVRAFGIVITTAVLAGFGGWCWGRWRMRTGYAEGWLEWMESLGVERITEFMTVGYIHNASYLGGTLGTLFGIACLAVGRRRRGE